MSDHNPFEAPSSSFDPSFEQFADKEYGGLRRGPYFGWSFGIGVINNVIERTVGAPEVGLALGVVGLVTTFFLATKRLKNLGYSGWWSIGLIVPILNILVGLRCMACPEGYADHKTLDTTGKVILGVVFGLFILALVVVFATVQA